MGKTAKWVREPKQKPWLNSEIRFRISISCDLGDVSVTYTYEGSPLGNAKASKTQRSVAASKRGAKTFPNEFRLSPTCDFCVQFL